jgi:hypothetical protein
MAHSFREQMILQLKTARDEGAIRCDSAAEWLEQGLKEQIEKSATDAKTNLLALAAQLKPLKYTSYSGNYDLTPWTTKAIFEYRATQVVDKVVEEWNKQNVEDGLEVRAIQQYHTDGSFSIAFAFKFQP